VLDSAGKLRVHTKYDSFGNLVAQAHYSWNGSTVTSGPNYIDEAFAYTGRWFDKDTGLQNNLNRWYDPTIGRWLSEDPIKADVNSYRYVGNSPANASDPNGLNPAAVVPWYWWLPVLPTVPPAAAAVAAAGVCPYAGYKTGQLIEGQTGVGAKLGNWWCPYTGDATNGDHLDEVQEAWREWVKRGQFQNWVHKEIKKSGSDDVRNPDWTKEEIWEYWKEWIDSGRPLPPGD
jgi:RHS repeat-associated protein